VTVEISNYGRNVGKKHYFFCTGLKMEGLIAVERKRPLAGDLTKQNLPDIFSSRSYATARLPVL
jgi:hypothetical protein